LFYGIYTNFHEYQLLFLAVEIGETQYRNLLMYCNTFSKAERKYSSNTWIHFHSVFL